jgi:hypothetical protein
MQQPVGLNFPGIPDFMPMPSPDMPRFGISRPQEFNQYGYSAPQVRQQMGGGMNLQPSDNSIIDSSYLAQLGILNQPQVLSAQADALGSGQTGTLGSGLINVPGSGGKGGGAPLIQDYRNLANRFKTDAAAKAAGMAATGAGDGGGGGSDGMSGGGQFSGRGVGADNLAFGILGATEGPLGKISPVGALANYGAGQYLDARTDYIGNQDFGLLNNVPGGMGTFADQYGNVGTYSSPATIAAQDEAIFGAPSTQFQDSVYDYGAPSTQFQDSVYDYGGGGGGGYDSLSSGNIPSTQFQDSVYDYGGSDSGGGGGGGGKIVCTAMNHAYGFGSFRNKIWLAYSAKNLTKAHEVGYHALFLPLVAVGYNQGDKMHNRIVRRVLENIARHRSADLRAEMRGTKRDPVGRAYRLILEPLCFAVGKLKGY